jgi:hypothetical protein
VYRLGENYRVRDWGGGREGALESTILIGLIRMFWGKASAPLTFRCVCVCGCVCVCVCGVCVCVWLCCVCVLCVCVHTHSRRANCKSSWNRRPALL